MVKKRISIFLISVLTITLIIVSVKYKSLLEEYNFQHNNANMNFQAAISIASTALSGSTSTVENYNNYDYNNAMTKIASSSLLFEFTTYAKENKQLATILNYLSNRMQNDEYKEPIIRKSKLISDELLKLSINPEDKQATENLFKLTKQISP